MSRISYAQAAEILDCHISNVAKLVRKGYLVSERRRNRALDHQQVLDLAASRSTPKGQRPRTDRYPDDDHWWITPAGASEILEITPQAVLKRIDRHRLPATRKGRRWWIRYDHLEMIERSQLALATRRP